MYTIRRELYGFYQCCTLQPLNRMMTRKRSWLVLFILICLGGLYVVKKVHYDYESLPSTEHSLQTTEYRTIYEISTATAAKDRTPTSNQAHYIVPSDKHGSNAGPTIIIKPEPDPSWSQGNDPSSRQADLTLSNAPTTEEELKRLDDLYNMTKVVDVDLENLTFLDNYYRYNYKVIEDRITDRMTNIERVCTKINNRRSSKYNLYKFNELNMTWCPVFKCGSTTWRNYFIDKFVRNPPKEYYLDLLKNRQLTSSTKLRTDEHGKQLYKRENEENIRFSMVRHPLDRLVSHVKSSGRDHEMVNQRGLWIQSAMIAGRSSRVTNRANDIKFKTEFDRYFLWLKGGKKGVFNKSSDNPYLDPPYPLLPELVNHIMKMRRSGRDWDGHWMPAQEFCNICIHKFDYIIKLEEEPLELWYLVEKLGLWDDRLVFLNRANSSAKKATKKEEVWENLKYLNSQQIAFLNKHFDVDLQMFDYKRL